MQPLREIPKTTLRSFRNKLDVKAETTRVPLESFKLNLLDESPTIEWKPEKTTKKIEVPATQQGIVAIGNILGVPSPWLKKADAEVRQVLLSLLLSRPDNHGEVLVKFNDNALVEINTPTTLLIDPRRMVDAAMHVIDPSAIVFSHIDEPGIEFRADIIVPEGFDRGIGGDKGTKRRVGDITRGGIRIGIDLKHHLAPWVSQFLMRLVCTNGMERCDAQWKVDARGKTVEDVLNEFEAHADLAFREVENTISAFYDLRNTPVDHPERTILRLAGEQGLKDATTLRLAEAAGSSDVPDEPTMFDIVNLITNQANDPKLADRPDVRRQFEQCGGVIVNDHAVRCGHCQAKLN